VRRLFPGFPSGPRGLGLLALRLVSAFALLDAGLRLTGLGAPADVAHPPLAALLGGALALCGVLLAAGCLTPIVVGVVTVLMMLAAFEMRSALLAIWNALINSWFVPVLELVVVVSLALLGPGRYSVDAYLFGRREIIIPPRSDSHD
jgi:uncharacterized membrane protein YphA (DoxX/SURF4 family)